MATTESEFTPLDPVIKSKWRAALESGHFRQGYGTLRPGAYTYCCLGVLCVLARDEGVIETIDGDAGHPPSTVREWAHLDSKAMAELISLNDSEEVPFLDISKWIGEHL